MAGQVRRFNLIHLVAIVAASAVVLAAITNRLGLAFWSIFVTASLVAVFTRPPTRSRSVASACLGPPTKREWLAIVVILVTLASLLVPALQHSH
jgi:hypothetical protein